MVELNELSKIGFGAYRVSSASKRDYQVLKYAINNGCNLIDTASNYMNGYSEELIGKFVPFHNKLFIVTKAGYIQGDLVAKVKRKFKYISLQNDFLKFSKTFYYSLHPDYLRWQIYKSLKRLNRKYIDGFLLHNPEYYLKHTQGLQEGQNVYLKIQKAFEFLEDMVHQGVIRNYGISSNILPLPAKEIGTIDLKNVLKIASRVASKNHFKLIQFPFNLNESEPLNRYEDGNNLLELSDKSGLLTFSNRPLNSKNENGIIRFATYENVLNNLDEEKTQQLINECFHIMQNRLNRLDSNENIFSFPVIKLLQESWKKIGNPEAVNQIFNSFFYPLITDLFGEKPPIGFMKKIAVLEKECILFSKKLLTEKGLLYRQTLIRDGVISKHDERPLSVLACQYLLDSGVKHVLVGMKQKYYVDNFKPFFK